MPDRNKEYYLEDIIFQVEDQLFKVHRRLFVKLSLVLRDMFKRAEADGLTDTQPFVLRGVEKKDFIPLLRCLYPMQFPANSNFSFTLEEWKSVLKLASLYEMAEVKTLVIEKMEPLLINLPSLQIHLAKTYNIQKWPAPALYRLTQRAKPLGEEDVELVGLSDSLKICALREKIRRCEKCGTGIHSGDFGLREIGRAFNIRDSDLSSSVTALGYEQNCTCSKAQLSGFQVGLKPAASANTFGSRNSSQSSPSPSTAPQPKFSSSGFFASTSSPAAASVPARSFSFGPPKFD